MEENTQQPNKRINIKVFLIMVLLVAVVVLFIHFATDLFKTPEQLFKKYLLNSAVEISKFNTEPYEDVLEESEDEPAEFKLQVEHDVPLNSSYFDVEIGENNEIVESKLIGVATFRKGETVEKESLNIEIKKNQQDFFNFDIVKDGNIYGASVPGIYEKYIAVENKDLKKIAETLGLEQEVIDTIPNSIVEKSTFTNAEIAKLSELALNYTNKIFEQIDSSFYTKENYIITEFDGESISGTKFILTIPEETLSNILLKTIRELFNDEEFLLILEEKVDKEELNKFKENIESDEFLEIEENAGNIEISVYKSKNKTVRLKIVRGTGNTFQATFVNKENSSRIKAEISVLKTEEEPVGYETVFDLTNVCENNNGELKLNITNTYNKNDISKIRIDRFSSALSSAFLGTDNDTKEYSTDNDTKEYSTDNDIKEYDTDKYKDSNITLKVNSSSAEKEVNSKFYIEGIETDEDIKLPEISFSVKVGEDIQVSSMDEKILINDYTQEDFNSLGEEIGDNIIKYAGEEPNSFIGMIYNSINLYQLSMQSIFDPTIEENETYKKALEQYKAREFNKEYLDYIGEVDGTTAKKLISKMQSKCIEVSTQNYMENNAQKMPIIIYEDSTVEYSGDYEKYWNDTDKIKSNILNKNTYVIKAFVDDTGYINKITISDKENS